MHQICNDTVEVLDFAGVIGYQCLSLSILQNTNMVTSPDIVGCFGH